MESMKNHKNREVIVLFDEICSLCNGYMNWLIDKAPNGVYKITYIFIITTTFIRDFILRVIAKKRFKWFGVSNSCRIPSKETFSRFF
jgi:predicted DCC family thiol-disulfide oxidoreductase YuxK